MSEKGEEDIDLEQVVWDPRYRRRVIERLNGSPVGQEPVAQHDAPEDETATG